MEINNDKYNSDNDNDNNSDYDNLIYDDNDNNNDNNNNNMDNSEESFSFDNESFEDDDQVLKKHLKNEKINYEVLNRNFNEYKKSSDKKVKKTTWPFNNF